MDLFKIGFLILSIGLSILTIRYIFELITILEIKKWLNKNKAELLKNEKISNKYEKEVINSIEYKEIKELYDENLIFIKSFARIGLNYTDFLFFQNLIEEYEKLANESEESKNIFIRLKKLIWIIIMFESSLLAKNIGLYITKLSMVYFIILFIYDKLI